MQKSRRPVGVDGSLHVFLSPGEGVVLEVVAEDVEADGGGDGDFEPNGAEREQRTR